MSRDTFFKKKNSLPDFNIDILLNNVRLKYVNTVKDLGVELDAKLLFETHVEKIVQRANRNLGFILRLTHGFTNHNSLINLYNSTVRPILEFSSVVWNPMYRKYVDRVESVQKKFVSSLNFRFGRQRHFLPYHDNLVFYGLQTLESRRKLFDVIFVYKTVNNLIDSEFSTNYLLFNAGPYTLRNRNTFNIKSHSSNYFSNSPLIRCARSCNSLPQGDANFDLFSVKIGRFKRFVRNHLALV